LIRSCKSGHTQFKGYTIGGYQEIGADFILEADEHFELLDALLAEQRFMVQRSHPTNGKAQLIPMYGVSDGRHLNHETSFSRNKESSQSPPIRSPSCSSADGILTIDLV
jgi:hypothetical protein